MNLSTSDMSLSAKRMIQGSMYQSMEEALYACEELYPQSRKMALKRAEEVQSIKYEIGDRAEKLGYKRICRDSIPICRGECCRWHFPQNIGAVDFYLALLRLSRKGRSSLVRKLQDTENKSYQCPLLCEDGCFFSFNERPIVCTNAYPCFAEREYWELIQTKKKRIKNLYFSMEEILQLT